MATHAQLSPTSQRTISVRHTQELIGPEPIAMILEKYKAGFTLQKILDLTNGLMIRAGRSPLSLVDVYAILRTHIASGTLAQRKKPDNEMHAEQFRRLLKTWEAGGTRRDCGMAVLPFTNQYFIDKCYKAVLARYRTDREDQRKQHESENLNNRNAASQMDVAIMQHGFRSLVFGKLCICIPLTEIPNYLLDILAKTPTLIENGQAQELTHQGYTEREGKQALAQMASQYDKSSIPKLDLKFPVESFATESVIPAPEIPTASVATVTPTEPILTAPQPWSPPVDDEPDPDTIPEDNSFSEKDDP